MYTVIGHPKTRAKRLIWMLEELEQDYDLLPAPPRSEEMRAFNPSAKAPVLKDGDAVVIDSVAASVYLADKHGRFTRPAGTLERARMDSMIQFTVDEVEGALWTAAKHSFVFPEERRVAGVKEACRWEFDRAMTTLEARLDGQDYAAGDDFTVADVILGHCAGWAENAKFTVPGGAVGAYFDRVRSRPAYARMQARAEA